MYLLSIIIISLNIPCFSAQDILQSNERSGVKNYTIDNALESLIKEYKRPITILEIGLRETPVIFQYAVNQNIVCIGMLIEGGEGEAMSALVRKGYRNMMILAPHNIAQKDLETLGQCEHFDIVIVHDITLCLPFNLPRTVDALLSLGDHCFVDVQAESIIADIQKKHFLKRRNGEHFLHIHTPKAFLDRARFTQKQQMIKPKPYKIRSTYTEKFFSKSTRRRPTRWIEGINLVTFAMLKGVYPADARIRQQIKLIEKSYPEHNDLVLGNIIVQGDKLIPIDMGDKRRNADINHCVTAAMHSFKAGNKRLVNPERWIKSYYNSFV